MEAINGGTTAPAAFTGSPAVPAPTITFSSVAARRPAAEAGFCARTAALGPRFRVRRPDPPVPPARSRDAALPPGGFALCGDAGDGRDLWPRHHRHAARKDGRRRPTARSGQGGLCGSPTACGEGHRPLGPSRRGPVGIYGGGPAFDYDFGALQTGLDLYRNEYENGQRDNAGLYLAVGQGSAEVEHNLLGRTFKGGEDDFDAVSVGGYWTRFGENNWYLDGVVQGTWYDMDMTGGVWPARRRDQRLWFRRLA